PPPGRPPTTRTRAPSAPPRRRRSSRRGTSRCRGRWRTGARGSRARGPPRAGGRGGRSSVADASSAGLLRGADAGRDAETSPMRLRAHRLEGPGVTAIRPAAGDGVGGALPSLAVLVTQRSQGAAVAGDAQEDGRALAHAL